MKKSILAAGSLLSGLLSLGVHGAAANINEHDDRNAASPPVQVVIDVEVNNVRFARMGVTASPGRAFTLLVPISQTDIMRLRCETRIPAQRKVSVVCKPSSSQHAVWQEQFIWMEPTEGKSDYMNIKSPAGDKIKVETRYAPVRKVFDEHI